MKKTDSFLTTIMLLCVAGATAQPVILNGANVPVSGFSAQLYSGPASVGPGAGGAGVMWDFSALSLSAVGTYAVLNPSATPVAASFPSGNFALSVTPAGGSALYSYYIIGSTGETELANSVTATVGSGRDYTPGPRKILKFPFNYTDTFTSNYATTTTTGHDFFEYDGYGTLKTPWATYNNVVRIKDTYTTAIGYAYNWYILSPLLNILSYDSNSNTFTGMGAVQTGAINIIDPGFLAVVAPNPFTVSATLRISGNKVLTCTSVVISDVTGRVVKQVPVSGAETEIDRDGLSAGVYLYHIMNNGRRIANGKLVIN